MQFRNRQSLVALWIGLIFLIPGLGIMHALPHAHAEGAHPVSEPAPAPGSHHDHGHDHRHDHGHEHPPAAPEEGHHHHTLDDHLESDPLRVQKRTQGPGSDHAMIEAPRVEAPVDALGATTFVVASPTLKTVEPPDGDPARAPPAQD